MEAHTITFRVAPAPLRILQGYLLVTACLLVGTVAAQGCPGGAIPSASILSAPLDIYSCRGQLAVFNGGVGQVYQADAGPTLYLNGSGYGFSGGATSGSTGSAGTWTFVSSSQLSPTSYRDNMSIAIPGGTVLLSQVISYSAGTDRFSIQLSVTNNTPFPIPDVRMLYGVDAYVNGDDADDYGLLDWATTRSVGVRDDLPSPLFQGLTGFAHAGDPGISAMHYYTNTYSNVWAQIRTGELPSTLDTFPQDQGVAIDFHKANTLAPGEVWDLEVSWIFSFPSAIVLSSCNVQQPSGGASVSGNVSIVWDGNNSAGLPLTSTLQFSTNSGVSWTNCPAAGGSPTMNPDVSRATPFTGATFLWDSVASGVGLIGPQLTDVRVLVTDGTAMGSCAVQQLRIDNSGGGPDCMITAPMTGSLVSGNVPITFNGTDPMSRPVTSTIRYSTNGGVSYANCTRAVASALNNPDLMRPTPFAGVVFTWNSVADAVGTAGPQNVTILILADNGLVVSQCVLPNIFVNNLTLPPACNITSPAPAATVSADVQINYMASDPASLTVLSTFHYSTNGGLLFLNATTAAGSPTANPDIYRPTPLSTSFRWNSVADGVGVSGIQNVIFAVRVTNGAAMAQCTLMPLFVDNVPAGTPTCNFTAPAAGALTAGDVSITFGGTTTMGLPMTSYFYFSTNAGSSYQFATAAAGSPLGNPDSMRATPFAGVTFIWDSQADRAGYAVGAPQNVLFRISIDDGTAASNCNLAFSVDNKPGCVITLPVPASTVAGNVQVQYDGSDASGDPILSIFSFSTDAGTTFANATAAASSAISNPDFARPTPFVGLVFTWNTVADGVGVSGPEAVLWRTTVTDGPVLAVCQNDFIVDNFVPVPTCGFCGDCDQNGIGPTILDSLTAAKIAVALIVPSPNQVLCCDVNLSRAINILDALAIAQYAAGLPVILTCP